MVVRQEQISKIYIGEKFELFFVFHAFGRDGQAEIVGQSDERVHQSFGFPAFGISRTNFHDERPVDLQAVDGQ